MKNISFNTVLVRFLFLAIPLLSMSCEREDDTDEIPTTEVTFSFTHLVGTAPLVYNASTYTNQSNEQYSIEQFKFFVSNIRLRNSETNEVYAIPESYHLISPTPENQMRFDLSLPNIPVGTYDEIEFALGIDEERNLSLDQVGDLDPASNMVWDWNTGYKFLLLEGRYFPDGGGETVGLVYHIGTVANYRTLRFPLNGVTLSGDRNTMFDFTVDLAAIFDGKTQVSFAENNVVMFQEFSQLVSANYAANMITLASVR